VIPEDLEWCDYAEIYDPPAARASNRVAYRAVPDDHTLPGAADPKTAGLTAIDTGGKGEIDLLVWSSRGAALYRRGTTLATDSGLEGLRDVIDIAPGDFDNDGLMDLCVLTPDGPTLYRNAGGRLVKFSANLPAAAIPTRRLDRLRSRFGSRSRAAGRFARVDAQSGPRRIRGSDLGFPLRPGPRNRRVEVARGAGHQSLRSRGHP
jgi:hypothetical protein